MEVTPRATQGKRNSGGGRWGEEKGKRKIRFLPQLLGVPSLLHSTGDTRLKRPVEFCFSKANFPLRDFLPSLSVSPLDSDRLLLYLGVPDSPKMGGFGTGSYLLYLLAHLQSAISWGGRGPECSLWRI